MTLPPPRDPTPRGLRDWVYVTLAPGDPYWRPVRAGSTPPTDGAVFIAGWLWGEGLIFPVREFFLSEMGAQRLQHLIGEWQRSQPGAPEDGEPSPSDEPYPLGVELSLIPDGSAIPVALYWGDEQIK